MKTALYVICPLAIAALWALAASVDAVPAILLPSPAAVAGAFVELAKSGALLTHTLASGARAIAGFALAGATGIALGLWFSRAPRAERASHVVLECLRVTPPLAMIPLLILWFGIGEAPKIAIVFLSGFFPIYLNTLTAFRSVDGKLLEVGASLDFSREEMFRLIMLPAAMPGILTGLRLGFGYSWRALVGAELIAASSGLGYLINESGEYLKTDCVFAGIITIAVLGIVADWFLAKILHAAMPSLKLPRTMPTPMLSRVDVKDR